MASLIANALFDVEGRWIAITGAASGIGQMLAKGFVMNGANTILIDRSQKGLNDTKSDLQSLSSSTALAKAVKVITICEDLSSEAAIQSVIKKIKAADTPLDAIIHCAGVRVMNDIIYTPGEDLMKLEAATSSTPYGGWEKSFQVNVMAPYFLTAGLISLLGAAASKGDGRGCVIIFSSPASVHNHQFVPCYQTSKAAVDHLVRIMAAEFADFYIRVNSISPGIIPSGITPVGGTGNNLHLANQAPAGRAGTAEDMVGTALWLVSKAGSFMDGKVIRPEGGRLLILKGVTSNSD